MIPDHSLTPLSVGVLRALLGSGHGGGDAPDSAPILVRTTAQNGLFRIETIAPAVAARLEGRTLDPSRDATVLEFVIDAGSP